MSDAIAPPGSTIRNYLENSLENSSLPRADNSSAFGYSASSREALDSFLVSPSSDGNLKDDELKVSKGLTPSITRVGTGAAVSLDAALQCYDKAIDDNTVIISKQLQNRRYFQAVKVITAILAVVSALILVAAFAALPFAAVIVLMIVTVLSIMVLSFSSINTTNRMEQLKSSKETILIAKILKAIYSCPIVKEGVNFEDEEFAKTHAKIVELFSTSIPAGHMHIKALRSILKDSSNSKESVDTAIRTTLMQFICLIEPDKMMSQEIIGNKLGVQFSQHVEIFLQASSQEQIAKLLLETENDPQPIDAEKLNDKNGVFA